MARMWLTLVIISLLAFPSFAAPPPPPDSGFASLNGASAFEGNDVFHVKGCGDCHSYDNAGGSVGPDLGTDRMRGKTASAFAAAMWSHAPTMWHDMGGRPTLDLREAAALYAFFYSKLYFDRAYPDLQHGQRYFESRCASCHDRLPQAGVSSVGPPVSTWGKVKDPMTLTALMWNHSTPMLDRMNRDSKPWPRMTGQDVTDLLAYFWRLPQLLPEESRFRFGNDDAGKAVFSSRCADCHSDLTSKLRRRTLPEVAASMWDHAPEMRSAKGGAEVGSLSETEMRDLLTYLVIRPLFNEAGDPGKGLQVFQTKRCNACHGENRLNPGTPPLKAFKGSFDAVRMTSALWAHGPTMLSEMKSAGLTWPRIKESEMTDLIAYLNQNTRQ